MTSFGVGDRFTEADAATAVPSRSARHLSQAIGRLMA
jgi:hypothetical protein